MYSSLIVKQQILLSSMILCKYYHNICERKINSLIFKCIKICIRKCLVRNIVGVSKRNISLLTNISFICMFSNNAEADDVPSFNQ
jgi:hypothetical protein